MTAVTGCIMLHVPGAGVVDTSDVISASCREMAIRTTLQTSCNSSSKRLHIIQNINLHFLRVRNRHDQTN